MRMAGDRVPRISKKRTKQTPAKDPGSNRPNAPTRIRPESGGPLRQPSDVQQALGVGEDVYRRYDQSTQNPLVKGKLGSRPFPYGALSQVENIDYKSLLDSALRHMSERYGGPVDRAHLGGSRMLPTVSGQSGYAYLGEPNIYFSPGAAMGTFSGQKNLRDFGLRMGLHEYAHTRQSPVGMNRARAEGGADLFAREAAPEFYRDLGIGDVAGRFSNPQYAQFARLVQGLGGVPYVMGQQFRPRLRKR